MEEDKEQLNAVRTAYLEDPSTSLEAVASQHGVAIELIQKLAEDQDWYAMKKEFFSRKYEERNMAYREAAAERRLPMVNRQLELLETLQKRLLGAMDDYDAMSDTRELRRVAETITGITASLNSLLGVQEALKGQAGVGSTTNLFFLPGAQPRAMKNVTPTA
jgi:DNA repair exonuclease SbcCD ATPase subunit